MLLLLLLRIMTKKGLSQNVLEAKSGRRQKPKCGRVLKRQRKKEHTRKGGEKSILFCAHQGDNNKYQTASGGVRLE